MNLTLIHAIDEGIPALMSTMAGSRTIERSLKRFMTMRAMPI